jgi:UDP-N-acetylmuramate dehydrogenase
MAITIIENQALAKYTSWRIGGSARYFVQANSPEDLREALNWARERDIPVCILGGGTNVLVRDEGYPGLVLRYRDQSMRIDEEAGTVWLAGGAPMAGSVRRLAAQGWGGLEWAEGLPGTIGGAIFGNAGCYGGDVASTLNRAWVLIDGEIQEWPAEEFAFGYRTSKLKIAAHELAPSAWHIGPIVVGGEFRIHREDPAILAERMQQTARERKGKTPVGSSCGSVFKNPAGHSSGRLIEQCGLKGTRVGAAEISQKHANYIVNLGGATSKDVLGLVAIVKERVFQEFGIELELEVQLIG